MTTEAMMVLTPTNDVLSFTSPHMLCMAMQAAAAGGLAYPTPGDVRWAEKSFAPPPLSADPKVWHPYAMTASGFCLKPWYSGIYRYINRTNPVAQPVERLDPADWRVNLANLISDLTIPDDYVRGTLERMVGEYVEPRSADLLMMRNLMDERVRIQAAAGQLVFNTKTARAMIASAHE